MQRPGVYVIEFEVRGVVKSVQVTDVAIQGWKVREKAQNKANSLNGRLIHERIASEREQTSRWLASCR